MAGNYIPNIVNKDKIFTFSRRLSSTEKISYQMKFFFLLGLIFEVTAQSPVFSLHPVSTAGVDGSTVEFTCTANNTDLIDYRVNSTSATQPAVRDKGFVQQDPKTVDGTTTRVLSVAVSSLYNNTEIYCRAIGEDNNVDSNTAILTVQGPLLSVTNFSSTFIDSSTVNISWSPPFTLPGTNITGYNISATSNGTTTNYFTSDSYYMLLLTDIFHIFCELNFTVSGYNGLEGKSDSTIVPSVKPTAPLSVNVLKNLAVIVIISFADDVCIESYSAVNVTVSLMTNKSLIDSQRNTFDSVMDYLGDSFTVMEDQNYIINVDYSIFGIEVFNQTTFNTYGVESITIRQMVDGIVTIICQFNSFSTDTGCTVHLVQDNSVQYNENFDKIGSIAEGNITVMSGGVYDIRAFDEGSTVVADSLQGVNIAGMIQSTTTTAITSTSMITTTTSTSSMSMSSSSSPSLPSTPSGSNVPILIISVVVGVVVALLLLIICVPVIVATFFILKKKNTVGDEEFTLDDQTDTATDKSKNVSCCIFLITLISEALNSLNDQAGNSNTYSSKEGLSTNDPVDQETENSSDSPKSVYESVPGKPVSALTQGTSSSSVDDTAPTGNSISVPTQESSFVSNNKQVMTTYHTRDHSFELKTDPPLKDSFTDNEGDESLQEYSGSSSTEEHKPESHKLQKRNSKETIYSFDSSSPLIPDSLEKSDFDKVIAEDKMHLSTNTNKDEDSKPSVEQKPVQVNSKLEKDVYVDLMTVKEKAKAPPPLPTVEYAEVGPHKRGTNRQIITDPRTGFEDHAPSIPPSLPPKSSGSETVL